MKKLKVTEVDKAIIDKFRTGHKQRSPNASVFDNVATLEVGEALEIANNEWYGVTTPSTSISSLVKLRAGGLKYPEYTYALSEMGRKFICKSFNVRKTDDGYVIIRNPDRRARITFLKAVAAYDAFVDDYRAV